MNINPLFRREIIKRLRNWSKGIPQAPILIDLEPTFGCNLKCRFCWQRDEFRIKATDYSRTIPDMRLMELVREAARMGVCEWNLAGGWEPTLKPGLARGLMKSIKDNGMYGCITTNGTLFDDNWIKECVESGWDRILFSLEGPDPETHDSLTQVKGSFERLIRNVEHLKKWKEKLGSKKPYYSFHSVLCSANYKKIKEMIDLAFNLGAGGIAWEPMNPWSEDARKLALNETEKKELQKHIKDALEHSWHLSIPTNLERFYEKPMMDKEHMDTIIKRDTERSSNSFSNLACYAPWLNMEIRASGHAVVCRLCDNHSYAPQIQENRLEEIWHGRYFNEYRERFSSQELMPFCRSCASGFISGFREIRKELGKKGVRRCLSR